MAPVSGSSTFRSLPGRDQLEAGLETGATASPLDQPGLWGSFSPMQVRAPCNHHSIFPGSENVSVASAPTSPRSSRETTLLPAAVPLAPSSTPCRRLLPGPGMPHGAPAAPESGSRRPPEATVPQQLFPGSHSVTHLSFINTK